MPESREAAMVTIERDASGRPTVWCDPEIATVVSALVAAGLRTTWSCSGHGFRPGVIGLADGRSLMVLNTDADLRQANAAFPLDINGQRMSISEPAEARAACPPNFPCAV